MNFFYSPFITRSAWTGPATRAEFRSISDDRPVDLEHLSDKDKNGLFYKNEPYTTPKLHQRQIITYSHKYAAYQKAVRNSQVERAKEIDSGKCKNNVKNRMIRHGL